MKIDYKTAYENVMVANKMLEKEIERLKIIEEKYKDSQLYIKDFKDEIERLNQYIDFYKDLIERQNKDLERLNNIINELEIWCLSWKENDKYCYLASNDKDKCRYDIWEEVLDKLQELKGNNNGVWVNNLLEIIKENNIEFGSDKE